ncbi:FAD:protein FMN transferase [Thioalkalivibrio sp. XN8]|nr:FAD:protein FMN transferase [Thioalkalivibrio sp. XN8]
MRAWLLPAILLLAACGPGPEEAETRHRFMAMGTLVDVTLYGVPAAEAEAAAREVETLFHALHREWQPYGDGALGQLNHALGTVPGTVPTDLATLIAEAERLAEATGGLFDPRLGALVKLWGFGSDETMPAAPPPPEAIAAWLATRPVEYDLGGFAKGVAVDRAIELLQARGIEHAIVNAGGDLRAIGRKGERRWRIGIRAPRDAGKVMAALEAGDDESVFTSGDYERWFEFEGRRYHHILDPRTGYPTEGLASVTVLHTDAALADAAATALAVAGPADWPATAAALGLEAVMVVHDDGRIELTPAMQPRVWFTSEDYGRQARVRSLP